MAGRKTSKEGSLIMRVILIAFTNIEYTIQLAEGLSRLADVKLMIPNRDIERFQGGINSDSLSLIALYPPRLRHITNLIFIYKMVRLINDLRPDVIHIQRGHPWFNFALPFLNQYCIVTTIHDVTLHSGDKESSIIPPFTHKLAIKYANQIIVHGKKLKKEMTRESGKSPDDINVLHRGVNSIYLRYIKESIKEEKQSILFFGRIFEYKGLQYLIEAEPLITEKIPDIKIIIAGRGEDFKKKYQGMVVNKDRFIIYNEHISNKMVAELFQKASVVVLPYIDASQSGVVPLAYAFKKPVVVTDVGSLPEVVDIGITGYIVPPKNSEKLAQAIIDILKDNEKLKKMGENAFKKTQEELSWENIASKTVEVYKKAIFKHSLK